MSRYCDALILSAEIMLFQRKARTHYKIGMDRQLPMPQLHKNPFKDKGVTHKRIKNNRNPVMLEKILTLASNPPLNTDQHQSC